jgi:hypothetical protein
MCELDLQGCYLLQVHKEADAVPKCLRMQALSLLALSEMRANIVFFFTRMAVGNNHDVKHPENKFQDAKLLFAPFITHCLVQSAGVHFKRFGIGIFGRDPEATSELRVLSGKSL